MLGVMNGTWKVLLYDWMVAKADALDTPTMATTPSLTCLQTGKEKKNIFIAIIINMEPSQEM